MTIDILLDLIGTYNKEEEEMISKAYDYAA